MDRAKLGGVDRPATVDWIAEKIEDSAERFLADRNGHRLTGIDHFHPTNQTVRRPQCDAANTIAAELLLHFAGQMYGDAFVIGVDSQGVVNLRQMALRELGVEGRANDLHDLADMLAIAEVLSGGNHVLLRRG